MRVRETNKILYQKRGGSESKQERWVQKKHNKDFQPYQKFVQEVQN